ncbi:MAG: twin-arginine translocase subunit TatC [Candidatus Woesearchaeota archaeon]|jgi:sec-independent protein translocase protein TatC|nr:twin-arginine translocase subunit TatC [Candidatus Woesearchaeota archaeon]MDP7506657.1 twin-arginine translocase subunit TatC [Candidatus Woesearchaeota archaeon]|tara:strand:+ start:4676 stop:5362 length:687 start_codon:yes stop_codon:yes gene_type:complete
MKLHLYEHLDELRKRFLIIIIFLLLFFVIGFSLSNYFIKIIINDLILIENVKIIGLTPVEYILTQIRIGFIISLIITIPIIIYQALVFIIPGLRRRERDAIKFILPAFFMLFVLGISFAYFIFLPIAIYFLGNLSTGVVENVWSIKEFINFVILSCLGSALVFQLPLLLVLLNKLNIISLKQLKKYRSHVYVLIFLMSALITPPDIITMVIIALPLIVLYEVSLLAIR